METIEVPVLSHVLKYLHFHLSKHYMLSESDPFGLLLFHLLRRPVTDARRDHVLKDYPARWVVGMGTYGNGRWGLRPLTGRGVYQLNNMVHQLVLAEMHSFVELAVDHGQQAKFAMEGFMGKYGFGEEDIQFETLKKSWTRYCAERKAKKKKVVSLTGYHHLRELQKALKTVLSVAA